MKDQTKMASEGIFVVKYLVGVRLIKVGVANRTPFENPGYGMKLHIFRQNLLACN